jgi:NADH-quinone oxidoreductase subunit I
MAIKVTRPNKTIGVNTYLGEIVKGLALTMKHMTTNVVTGGSRMMTVSYPEQKRPMPRGYRGKHRLTLRDDGQVKCVACMMCATNCPARCISIVAGEHPDPNIEKFPVSFQIDLLECVFCGMCVEACPCDAIRMDSGEYAIVGTDRKDFIITKDQLMAVQPQYEDERNPRTPKEKP